jgi:cytochrome c oxidase subunit IV
MTTSEQEHAVAHREEHAHPGPRRYVEIAILLAVFTAVEVALSYLGLNDAITIIGLSVLMVVKFAYVVLYFMHLKFDPSMFTVMFVGGLALAVIVFIAVLSIQRVMFV